MDVGYVLDTHFGAYDQAVPDFATAGRRLEQLASEAAAADAAGFAGVFVPDRHGRTESAVSSPLVMLSSLVAHVPRARLGVYSLVLTAYHPMLIAEEAAMVDLLSGGRLTLAVSMGYHPSYWRQFGIDGGTRKGRFEDGLRILKQAWHGEKFSFEGSQFTLSDVLCTPPPRQSGGPPLWIGGEAPAQLSRAARLADGWAAGMAPMDVPRFQAKVAGYREEAEQHGKRGHVVLMRDAFVADSRAEAIALAADSIIQEQLFYFRVQQRANRVRPDAEFATAGDYTVEKLRKHVVLGTPEECAEQLEYFREVYGVDEFVLRMRWPNGPAPEAVQEAIGLVGEQVLPRLERAT
jgi:alkanesulfonate monooxygenase SsuD/methylene tetrahydromethanopterin reductase-like flavin-dependent oxidoreductase (luciferase family)